MNKSLPVQHIGKLFEQVTAGDLSALSKLIKSDEQVIQYSISLLVTIITNQTPTHLHTAKRKDRDDNK